jgi:CCR4-NOT transcription complex subunit 9
MPVFTPPYPGPTSYMPTSSYTSQGVRPNDIQPLVRQLTSPPLQRAEALHTLSVQREQIPDLAVMLWESPATITALLTESLSLYPHLASTSSSSSASPASLNGKLATRVWNVLALFQCVAGHEETRTQFIQADIPMYLFPFLHTTNQSRECECCKLTSLGIIGSLVKADDSKIIDYLLTNEFVPLCLRILKFGQEMSKIVAAFIVQKILNDKKGIENICAYPEKRDTVLKVLNIVLNELGTTFSQRLSKNIVLSYESMLKAPGVPEAIVRIDKEAPIQVLHKERFSTECDESFLGFIETLRGIVQGRRP